MIDPVFRSRKLLLDANLSVLLCVGLTGVEQIDRHKRLKSYDREDFNILMGMVRDASDIAISPNIATETSNIARQAREPLRTQVSNRLRGLIEEAQETYIASAAAVGVPEFARLGESSMSSISTMSATRAKTSTKPPV